MKLLTLEKMIALLEATPQQVEESARYFGKRLGDGEWIKQGLMAGHYKAETVTVDGKESYMAVFHISDQGFLVINAFARMGGGDSGLQLIPSLKALARKYGCTQIEGMTMRPGMAKTLIAGGFKPVGIAVSLEVND